jgi:dynactin-2
LELLNERNLDAIKTRTNALMHEFNRLSVLKEKKEVQQALATSEDKKKFNHLFDKFKQVEETSVLIPFLVERLTTLKNIHDEHLDLHTRMKQLETTKENIQQLLQRDANLLTNVSNLLYCK